MSTEVESEKSPPSLNTNGRLSWLKPKQSEKRDSASFVSAGAPASVDVRVAAPVEESLQPISFFGLFRYVHLRPFSHAFFTLSHSGIPLARSSSPMAYPLLLRLLLVPRRFVPYIFLLLHVTLPD